MAAQIIGTPFFNYLDVCKRMAAQIIGTPFYKPEGPGFNSQ
jgi:hypothetical protein